MTVYCFYLFDRSGSCLCYREWNRPRPGIDALQDQRNVFGMLFAIKQLCGSLAPVVAAGGEQGEDHDEAAPAGTREEGGGVDEDGNDNDSGGGGAASSSSPDAPAEQRASGHDGAVDAQTYHENGTQPPQPPPPRRRRQPQPQQPRPKHQRSAAFRSFCTDAYQLHYFESATGLRFVLTTSIRGAGDLTDTLRRIYREVYVSCASKNPMYRAGTSVASEAFRKRLDGIVMALPVAKPSPTPSPPR